MLFTMLAPKATTGQAAAWPVSGDASDDHLAEPNVQITPNGDVPNPTIMGVARKPVAGLRAIVTNLVRTGVPRLPLGPPMTARMGQGQAFSGAKPKGVKTTQQFVPVTAAEQTGDWYDFLS